MNVLRNFLTGLLLLTSISSFADDILRCTTGNSRMTLNLSSQTVVLGQHADSNNAFAGGTPFTLTETNQIVFGANFYQDFISRPDSRGSIMLFRVTRKNEWPAKYSGPGQTVRIWQSSRVRGEPLEKSNDDSAVAWNCLLP